MNIKSCNNCRARWVCMDYECWIGLDHKEPDANKCKYYIQDEEE